MSEYLFTFKKNLNINQYISLKIDKENYIKEIKKINYGLDILKIFSMINIIILHINLFSGTLTLNYSNTFKSIWILQTMSFWAVNGFGIISGIVGYKQYKFSNLIYLWFQTFFYSIIFSLYLFLVNINKETAKNLLKSFFPLLIKRNWYVNAYFCMYTFLPFLNYGINNLNRKIYRNLLLVIIFFSSIYDIFGTIINGKNNYHFLNNGYSTMWLIILYLIGAYLGKYILSNNKKPGTLLYFICFISLYLFSSFFSFEIFLILKKKNSTIYNQLFIDYLSPTILLQALSLILIFYKLKIENYTIIRIISFFRPLNFNITLIHLRLFEENFILTEKLFKYVKNLNSSYFFFKIYGLAFIIYLFCSLIDYMRLILFKFLKIKNLCIFLENSFYKL